MLLQSANYQAYFFFIFLYWYLTQLSQAINNRSVHTAVGKCNISMFNIVVLLFSGLVILLKV